jgi:hypothetical protein
VVGLAVDPDEEMEEEDDEDDENGNNEESGFAQDSESSDSEAIRSQTEDIIKKLGRTKSKRAKIGRADNDQDIITSSDSDLGEDSSQRKRKPRDGWDTTSSESSAEEEVKDKEEQGEVEDEPMAVVEDKPMAVVEDEPVSLIPEGWFLHPWLLCCGSIPGGVVY